MAVVQIGVMGFRIEKGADENNQPTFGITAIQSLFATDQIKFQEKLILAVCISSGMDNPLSTDQVTEEVLKEFIDRNRITVAPVYAELPL
jgi:hypothetical protein